MIIKKLVGVAVLVGVAAAATKVVKDILKADEEEKQVIDLDTVEQTEEKVTEE